MPLFTRLSLTIICLLVLSSVVRPARAATFVVTTLNDNGPGSLRQAIIDANATPGDDRITFSVTGTITLTTGELVINGASTLSSGAPRTGTLEIDGFGITISRGGAARFRLINIVRQADVILRGLTLANGDLTGLDDEDGGAIQVDANATLTLIDSTVRDSRASGDGGGLYIRGRVTLINSTVSGNSTVTGVGAITSDTPASVITLINSTVHANAGYGVLSRATLTIINSTLTANGRENLLLAGGTATVRNVILSDAVNGINCTRNAGTLTASFTLIEDALTCISSGSDNITGDPLLGALTGSPAYFPLLTGSPAIDSGSNALIPNYIGSDQAGNVRIANGTVDRGAVEFNAASPAALVTLVPSRLTVEEGAAGALIVTRTGPVSGPLTVSLSAVAGADLLAADYLLTVGGVPLSPQVGPISVTIPAGETALAIEFTANDDIAAEADNLLTVDLLAGAGYAPALSFSSIVTIPNNDLVVTANDDSGDGTLRQAMLNANTFLTNDIITFTTAGPIVLTGPALPDVAAEAVSGALTLRGSVTVTRASPTDRFISTIFRSHTTIDGLTFTNGGSSVSGGGAIRNAGTLTLRNCTISGSQTTATSDGGGGGIYTDGVLNIERCTINGNSATTSTGGGGIYSTANGRLNIVHSTISGNSVTGTGLLGGAGILNAGNSTIRNSAVLNNTASATARGGGIYVQANALNLINVTVSGNSAGEGGGLFSWGISTTITTISSSTFALNTSPNGDNLRVRGVSTPSVNIDNSILAGTSGAQCSRFNGTITARNSVIETSAVCVNGAGSVNNVTTAPALGALTGSPAYHPLTAASLNAIDTGDNALIPAGTDIDQPGNTRIFNGTVDRGAHEYNSTTPVVVSITPAALNIGEGEQIDFTIARSGSTALALTVALQVTPTNADMTLTDYTLSVSGVPLTPQTGLTTVTIPAGLSSIALTFTALDDTPAEPYNSLTVALQADATYARDAAQSSVAAIPSNDFVVTVNADSVEGSLRQAVSNAASSPADETITFTTPGPVVVTNGFLLHSVGRGGLTLEGGGVIIEHPVTGTLFDLYADSLIIRDVVVRSSGEALGAFAYSALITDSTFSGLNGTGGTVEMLGGYFVIQNTTFTGAFASALRSFGSNTTAYIIGSTFTDNVTTADGAHLYVASGTIAFVHNSLMQNGQARDGGAIFNLGSVQITDSRLLNNRATRGGAIYSRVPRDTTAITRSCIVGNSDGAIVGPLSQPAIIATGNWWGSAWGPNIPSAGTGRGSFVSTGDQIDGSGRANGSVNVGIITTPADYGTYSVPPTGDWLLTPPTGCGVCDPVSAVGRARLCSSP